MWAMALHYVEARHTFKQGCMCMYVHMFIEVCMYLLIFIFK